MAERGPLQGGDFAPLDEIGRCRAALWPRQLEHVLSRSAFYQRHFARARPAPDLAALAELPFTTKAMLRADQAAHPPFGSCLAAPPEQIARIHRTSGTTGLAMNLALSAADAETTALVGARAQRAAGLGPGHRVVHCLNYQLWIGGYTDHATLEATGAAVIPFGVGSSEKLIETIRELAVTAISCTPSYPAVLERVIAERFDGLKPKDLGLKLGLFGGEAGLDDPNFRKRLESTWGFEARNANYGVSDVLCNFAAQCAHATDLHFVGADVLYPELIDPGSGDRLAFEDGAAGELVLTHLLKECQPLVRFRTGDIVTITGTAPCACGRTAPRFRVIGRADDMVVVRGVNVYPSMVTEIINRESGLSGEYRIVLEGRGPYDRLPLEVERAEGGQDVQDLAQSVAARIKRAIGVSADVRVLPPFSLERVSGKTRRVIRK